MVLHHFAPITNLLCSWTKLPKTLTAWYIGLRLSNSYAFMIPCWIWPSISNYISTIDRCPLRPSDWLGRTISIRLSCMVKFLPSPIICIRSNLFHSFELTIIVQSIGLDFSPTNDLLSISLILIASLRSNLISVVYHNDPQLLDLIILGFHCQTFYRPTSSQST